MGNLVSENWPFARQGDLQTTPRRFLDVSHGSMLQQSFWAVCLFGCFATLPGFAQSIDMLHGEALARWQHDLAYAKAEIPALHFDAFNRVSATTFYEDAEQLIETLPGRTEEEVVVDVMRWVASIGDGHTYFAPKMFRVYPIQVYRFADGNFITNALPEHAHLIGQRLVAVAGIPLKEVYERIIPLVAADSESQRTSWLPLYMTLYEVLRGTGLTDKESTPFTVADANGQETSVVLQPLDAAAYLDTLSIIPEPIAPYVGRDFSIYLNFAEALPSQPQGPLYLRHPDQPYWEYYLPEVRTLYIAYNFVRNGAESLAVFSTRLALRLDTLTVDQVIVDVRNNIGGNNSLNGPFVRVLVEHPKLQAPGSLYAILGRRTFSAATDFVASLENRTPAIFAGEPTGGSPNHYGNPTTLTLPETGHQVRVSRFFWEHSVRTDRRTSTEPQLAVALRSHDYFGGHDPVLAAVLHHTPRSAAALSIPDSVAKALVGTYLYEPDRTLNIETIGDGLQMSIPGFVQKELQYQGDGQFETGIPGVVLRYDAARDSPLLVLHETVQPLVAAPEDYEAPFLALTPHSTPWVLAFLQALYQENRTHRLVTERYVNQLGYRYLREGKVDVALQLFQLNIVLYPESANVYDSAGEAYLQADDLDAARTQYMRALSIDPQLQSAQRALIAIRENMP